MTRKVVDTGHVGPDALFDSTLLNSDSTYFPPKRRENPMAIARSSHSVRFGDFQVDLRAGELRKRGVKVKLPEQSFQILAMLLEHPGGLVTREEIQKKLWPHDTIVEFENSISAAIRRLRLALGDSADDPRFVETLARRGYRLIVAVDQPLETPGRTEARQAEATA